MTKKPRHWDLLEWEKNPKFWDAALYPFAERHWEDNMYGYIQECLLPKFNRPIRTCVDGGASYGWYTNIFSGFAKEIHSFEMQPYVFDCLVKNNEKAGWGAVLHNCALTDFEGEAPYTIQRRTSLVTVLDELAKYIDKAQPNAICEARTLDSFNLKDVDFIKLDLEKGEYRALQGSIETIKESRPICIIEFQGELIARKVRKGYHPEIYPELRKRARQVFKYFYDLSYSVFDDRAENFIFFPNEMM